MLTCVSSPCSGEGLTSPVCHGCGSARPFRAHFCSKPYRKNIRCWRYLYTYVRMQTHTRSSDKHTRIHTHTLIHIHTRTPKLQKRWQTYEHHACLKDLSHASHSGEIALADSRHLRSTLAAEPFLFAHAVATVAKNKWFHNPLFKTTTSHHYLD